MQITINMIKARTIHMNRIRIARNSKLESQDIPFMRAIESGNQDELQTISTYKQMLRDIPQTFTLDEYLDAESLKAAWPKDL